MMNVLLKLIKELHGGNIFEWMNFDIIEYKPDWQPFFVISNQTLLLLQQLSTERKLILEEKDIPALINKNEQLKDILRKIKSLELTALEED